MEVFSDAGSRYLYRVPVTVLRELSYEDSRYSPEFVVAGYVWRFHLQERVANGERFLALHLQSCTARSVPVHFKLSAICMRDPLLSRSKTFHCTFKRAGSAWGLHQFIPMTNLLDPDGGFVYQVEGTGARCVDFEVTLQVQTGRSQSTGVPRGRSISPTGNNGRGGSFLPMGSRSPRRTDSVPVRRAPGAGPTVLVPSRSGKDMLLDIEPSVPSTAAVNIAAIRAPLTYPFEHLESLCDMCFDVEGVRVKTHRCVIGARMRPLLPDQMLPLQVGCIVSIAVPLDVFTTFLRYVYTEEHPESGILPPESLLDLYLLSAACEFYDLSSTCIRYVRPLLSPDNVLPIVLTRYNAADEVLTSLYLRVLLENYDVLITDKQFEEIPGHLFRRLSLILYRKEAVPVAPIPPMRNTLGKQLAWLADTGEYSDMEWVVGPQKYAIRGHQFILASRCIVFSQAFNPRSPGPLPNFTTADFDFSLRGWQKLLTGIYRRHLDTKRDFSAEDIAAVFKMHTTLGMDGHLKREADEAFDNSNALRLLICAVKHHIPELHERAIAYVSSNFKEMIRNDPQAWELISELPQGAVLSLFRTVIENSAR